jgi:hypothetical protein
MRAVLSLPPGNLCMMARAPRFHTANFWQSQAGWFMIAASKRAGAARGADQGGLMRKQIALVPILIWSAISGALAQSQDEQQACTNDAFQFCQNFIPDRDRVFTCLVENRRVISAACHTVLTPYLPVETPVVAKRQPAARPKPDKSTKNKGPLNLSPQ